MNIVLATVGVVLVFVGCVLLYGVAGVAAACLLLAVARFVVWPLAVLARRVILAATARVEHRISEFRAPGPGRRRAGDPHPDCPVDAVVVPRHRDEATVGIPLCADDTQPIPLVEEKVA